MAEIGTACLLGATYGAMSEAWHWYQAPKYNPIQAAAKRGLYFGTLGFLFSTGTYTMQTWRNKSDSFNGGAGGALVGMMLGAAGGMHGMIYKGTVMGGVGILCSAVAFKVQKEFAKRK